MEHRGVEVVDGGDVFLGGVAEIVGGTVGEAALDAGAGEPHGHGFVVMIAADGAFVALRHGCATEFAAENDERVVEEAALLQIADERHAGAIDFFGAERQFLAQEAVVVPIAMVELDEACAAFGESAGEQAIRCEGAVAGRADATPSLRPTPHAPRPALWVEGLRTEN
jgi:hypothetical protein